MTEQETLTLWKSLVENQFKDQMVRMRTERNWQHHGWFQLWYAHIPTQYRILVEGQFDTFVIRILASDRRFCPLQDLTDYPRGNTEEEIREALKNLELCLMKPVPFRQMRR